MMAGAGWRAMSTHGFADLSPPEVEHAMLELPTNRAEYVRVLQTIHDYPARSPIGQRIPADAEVAALARLAGRWRAIVLLDDERALQLAAVLFNRVFVLDPLYDAGALLYGAWHDPIIRDEHSRGLAEQAGRLVRAGRLLNTGTAVLAPNHLPGSWSSQPGWRRPRPSDEQRLHAAWSLRTSLVLLYWADRLDGVVCVTRPDVSAALHTALGSERSTTSLRLREPHGPDEAQAARDAALAELESGWAVIRRLSRRRSRRRLAEIACALCAASRCLSRRKASMPWRLVIGQPSLPDPALLIKRVLNAQDPRRTPSLPHKKLRRRPLCLVASSADQAAF